MPRDRRIVDGDYVSDGNGGYEKTATAETAVYHQLAGRRGQWWGDSESGSDIFKAARAKITFPAESVLRRALSRVEQAEHIRDIEIRVDRDGQNVIAEASAVDVPTGQPISVSVPVVI